MKQKTYSLTLDGGKAYALSSYSLAQDREAALTRLRSQVGSGMMDTVLSLDPEPMILKAVDLLDETDSVNGERTWLWGYWKFQVSQSVLLSKLAPAMKAAAGYRGHLPSGEHKDSVIRTLWFGLDPETNSLSAIVYVSRRDEQLRAGILEAIAFNVLEREYRLSLAPRDLTFDKNDPNRIIDFGDASAKKEISLDLVRYTGTKAARMKSAVLLSAEEADEADYTIQLPGKGGRKMRYEFESIADLMKDPDVQLSVDREVEKRLAALTGEQLGKVLSAAPLDQIKGLPAVKPYFERPTKEEVLKTLSAEDVKAALSGNHSLLAAAGEVMESVTEKYDETQRTSLELMTSEEIGLTARQAATVWALAGGEILLSKDPLVVVKQKAEAYKLSMGGSVGPVSVKGGVVAGGAPESAEAILTAGRDRLNKFRGAGAR